MIQFMEKYDVRTGFVVTEDYEATGEQKDKIIRFVPLWKWIFAE